MDRQIIIDSIQKLRDETRKNATMRETIRRSGITRIWYRGGLVVDMELELRRC